MGRHLRRSRVSKALTDIGLTGSFDEAEARLDAIHVCVAIDEDQACTTAGQAAALTAVVTAFKCFGRVSLALGSEKTPLQDPLRVGRTLAGAAERLGAKVQPSICHHATHVIQIGTAAPSGALA